MGISCIENQAIFWRAVFVWKKCHTPGGVIICLGKPQNFLVCVTQIARKQFLSDIVFRLYGFFAKNDRRRNGASGENKLGGLLVCGLRTQKMSDIGVG